MALVDPDGGHLRPLIGVPSVYQLALESIRSAADLRRVCESRLSDERLDYDAIVKERRLLPPLDHPDPAHCVVSLTGLTHMGSARSRDRMHLSEASEKAALTDSIRLFHIGVAAGKPAAGQTGAQPEWAYKGNGFCVVAPEQTLTQPWYAKDGGEEGEIAGLYVIDDEGNPWRVGFALGNEFSDHVMEKENYLYLAHSKLRQCSFGPELLTGDLPDSVEGTVRIVRDGTTVWEDAFQSGEANMCHSIENLERHHFKYELFRRPGDVHVHFFGADTFSYGAGFQTRSGDVLEIAAPLFGKPLRNLIHVETNHRELKIRSL